MSKAKQLLDRLGSERIVFSVENGKLRYSGPKGVMNDEYLTQLKECREELIKLVQKSKSKEVPIAFSQENLWFLEKKFGPNKAFNLGIAIRWYGRLDEKALKNSLEMLAVRHEILRTGFMVKDSRPFMTVSDSARIPFRVEDISHLPAEQRTAQIDNRFLADVAIPFDIARPSLCRAFLLKLGDEDFAFLVNCHHIVADGWSMGLFFEDLKDFYNAELGQGEEPPPLAMQFSDVAEKHRTLSEDKLTEEITFWKEYLENIPDVSTFPADHRRPVVPDFSGDSVSETVPERLVDTLNKRAKEMKTTLNVLLTTAFGLLISRFSKQDEVVIRTAFANRLRPELQSMIGMFVNILPIRLDLSGALRFSEYVSRVARTSMEIMRHSQTPLEHVLRNLDENFALENQTISQTYFSLLPPLGKTPEFYGLDTFWLQPKSKISRFDSSLYAEETAGGDFIFNIEYSTALYDKNSVKCWMRSMISLLHAVGENPHTVVDETIMISADDRKSLVKWGQGKIVEYNESSVIELFQKQVAEHPGKTAVTDGQRTLTYFELDRISNLLADVLEEGPDAHDYIGICVNRSTAAILSILSILKSMKAYVPLDTDQPIERREYIISNTELDTVIGDKKNIERLKSLSSLPKRIIDIDDFLQGVPDSLEDIGERQINTQLDQPAYVIYTSGSTGHPKGVVIPHRALLNNSKWHISEFSLSPTDRISQQSTLSFDASVLEIWGALCSGGQLHIVPDECRLDPMLLRDWIQETGITWNLSTTPLAEILLQLEWRKDTRLRFLVTGGDVLRIRPAPNMPFKTYNVYGPTENTVVTTFFPVPPEGDDFPEIGKPLDNVSCHILRDYGDLLVPVPPGVFGELCAGGASLGIGYLNNPEQTGKSFVYWSPSTCHLGQDQPDAIRIYRTGDLARFLPSGLIEFGGRIDHQVKIRGFRIELGEIENAIKRHPNVENAIVIVKGVEEKQLAAYFTFHGEDPDKTELVEHLQNILPSYMIPVKFVALAEFPMLPSGKIDRRKLPELDRGGGKTPLSTAGMEPSLPPVLAEESKISQVRRLFDELKKKGMVFRLENGRLRYSGPKGIMTGEYLAQLKECRRELINLLQQKEEPKNTPQVAEARNVPIAFSQEQLWFINQMMEQNYAYNMVIAVRWHGDLDIGALKNAVTKLAERHEILRTSFVDKDSLPFMAISESVEIPFRMEDISVLNEDARNMELQKLIRNEVAIPFDLTRAPLCRTFLLKLGKQEFIFNVICHHIVADGWSMGIIVNDLKNFYNAELGRGKEPAPLPVQFVKFAEDQRQALTEKKLSDEIAFWKKYLENVPDVSTMPADLMRPPIQDFSGASVVETMPKTLADKLALRAREMKTTLNVLLATSFGLLISRFSRQDDVAVGIAFANRLHPELEPMVGMFVNSLPLRLDFSGRLPFSDYVSRTAKISAQLLRHSQVPFERVLGSLVVERELGRPPINQTFFTLLPPLGKPPTFHGLETSWIQNVSEISKFDLTLYVEEIDNDKLFFNIEYSTSLYRKESAKCWMRSLFSLLEAVAENSGVIADESIIISPEDRQALADWEFGKTVEHTEASVLDLFKQQVKTDPENIAVTDENISFTYLELDRLSDLMVASLDVESTNGNFVGICLDRSAAAVLSIMAVVKSGAAYIPLDPDQPLERLGYMISNAELDTVITDKKNLALLQSLSSPPENMIDIDDFLQKLPQSVKNIKERPIHIRPEQPAYVIFTSGSTGKPKGVVLAHRGLLNNTKWNISQFAFSDKDRISQISSLSFDASVPEIWGALCSGGQLHIVPDECRLDPMLLRDWIQENGINCHFCPTPLAEMLLQLAWPEETPLRLLFTAGDVLRSRPAPDLPFEMFNLYGPTENTVTTTCMPLSSEGDNLPEIGRPIDNTSCHILKEYDNCLVPVPPGVFGELCIGGEGLAIGYLNNPEQTAKSFVYWSPTTFQTGPDQPDARRIYRTGDLARFLHSGLLDFGGRIDNQVKIRGFRIELGEVESAIKRHPGIEDAIVVVHGEGAVEKVLVAYFTSRENHPKTKELVNYLQNIVPAYMVPANFIALEQFPLLPSGKIDRKKLPDPFPAKATLQKSHPAKNTLEKKLANIWKEVLSRSSAPSPEDNFFDIGGHSLLLIKIRDRLKEDGFSIGVMDLFKHPTIAALASFIETDLHPSGLPKKTPALKQSESRDVAIIGMACRFPGAENINAFWDNLSEGRESISFFSQKELKAAGVPEKLYLDPSYVPANGMLRDIEMFDSSFFNIPPAEADRLDPQQRILLETAWETFENAGWVPGAEEKKVGVFVGTSFSPYFLQNIGKANDSFSVGSLFPILLGGSRDFVATRVAYKLNLKGPAVNVSTACSTSLVAVHMAVESLHSGQCEMALAGGATISPRQIDGYIYEEGGILSPDGHCRAFDADAGGFVGGNGAGLVLLKKLDDAVRDGDHIWAVIKGSAINNDGSEKIGFTAPSIAGQTDVISSAQQSGGIDPSTISYIEAQGTGTALGDPIEINALTQVFGSGSKGKYCAIGSVKTNIGHLDSAAGVAGLIKTALSLRHQTIPKSLHFKELNPEIQLDHAPFYISDSTKKWENIPLPRRAGVNSFGIGGTNAHVVLEEAQEHRTETSSEQSLRIIPISARTGEALANLQSNLASFLEQQNQIRLDDLAFTLAVGRKSFPVRKAFLADSVSEMIKNLRSNENNPIDNSDNVFNLAFMFTGQGAQHHGMGSGLLRHPVFRKNIDHCSEILQDYIALDLRDIVWNTSTPDPRLDATRFAQPAIFAFEYALAQLWISWGIKPDVMIGHSIGEWVAACLAGVFSLEDSLKLVALRGSLMDSQHSGKMLAVSLPEADIKPYLSPKISLATVNESRQCVVSGREEDIDQLADKLNTRKIRSTKLNTSHAFHSYMMDDAVAPFAEAVAKVERHVPKIPFVSNATGNWIREEEVTSPEYWAGHIRGTVRFDEGLKTLLDDENMLLLEVGPKRVLTNMALRSPARNSQIVFASLAGNDAGKTYDCLAETSRQLWYHGFQLDWQAYYQHGEHCRVPLPSYPFERKYHWLENPGKAKFNAVLPTVSPRLDFSSLIGELRKHEAERSKKTTATVKNADFAEPENENERIIANAISEVLGIDRIGRNDDFFSLGGDSLLLLQLHSLLKRKYGINIPRDAMMESPTPMMLAKAAGIPESAQAKRDVQKPSRCLIPFNEGSSDQLLPQIFMVHPVGGGVFCYRELFNAMQTKCPVYGLQTPGLLDNDQPFENIYDMAEHYVAAIRKINGTNHRQCVLLGHSFGGIVVFEMARILDRMRETPALSILVDAPGPGHLPKTFRSDEELMAFQLSTDSINKDWQKNLDYLNSLPENERWPYFTQKIKDNQPNPDLIDDDLIRRGINIIRLNLKAMNQYRTEKWEGRLLFFKAAEEDILTAKTPEKAWEELASRGVEVITVPGNHISMLSEPNVSAMAEIINQKISGI